MDLDIMQLLIRMEEIWKTIEGYETYSVSTFGNVRNNKTGKILKSCKNCNNQLRVTLYKNDIKTTFSTYQLLAKAFIPNPENKEQVDHIDNDKLNNHLTNLRWATNGENQRNTKIPSINTSGVKGVHFHKPLKKWCARITINNVRNTIGYYDTIEEATLARQLKANELFGEFINSCEKH